MTPEVPKFNRIVRDSWISNGSKDIYDVAIVGGGITGAGIANLLSENGLKVILLERNDFGSGTSSGSTKLIHGGLRYLANLKFREVRTLLKERNYLSKNTEIVKFMNFRILLDEYSWKKYSLRTGLFIYNVLSGSLKIPKFSTNTGIYPSNVKGYFSYEDAYSDDTKLVIFNIASAVKHGAHCINYCEALDFVENDQRVNINILDKISGRKLQITSSYVINAAGPWSGIISQYHKRKFSDSLKLSKGVHLIVSSDVVSTSDAIVFRSHIDKRQMFIIPRGETVILGTTDEFISDPDDFTVTEENIDYIIESVRRFYPDLVKKDVLFSYAGIRPLYGNGNDPGSISRGFTIKISGKFIDIFGGKLTDYRNASREVGKVFSRVSHKKMIVKGMPWIDYKRPMLKGIELYNYERDFECALFPEDIIRRREAMPINRRDLGEGEKRLVLESFETEANGTIKKDDNFKN
jgi:glycerol-3-phosphate dehydrogenase